MIIFPHNDKVDHFMYWFAGSTVLFQMFNPHEVIMIGILAAFVKEILDGDNNTTKEHLLDITAGTLGTVAAVLTLIPWG